MSTTTTNYGLVKPATTDRVDITVLDADLDIIDAQMAKSDIFVNVKSYGAVGDGTTDDAAAITAAIAATPATAVLTFPAGTYAISSPLTVAKSLRIHGQGSLATTILAKSGFTGTMLSVAPATRLWGMEVSGLAFDLTSAPAQTGVRVSNGALPRVSDLLVKYGAVGLTVDGCAGGHFQVAARNQTTAGVKINQDAGGDNWFDVDIAVTDAAITMASGFELERTTATDTGGLFLDGRCVGGTGLMTTGWNLHSSAASTLNPIFLRSGVVADTVTGGYGFRFVNLVDITGIDMWSAGATGSYGVMIDGCQNVKIAFSKIQGPLGGITFANAPSVIQLVGNHAGGGNPLVMIPSASGDRPTALVLNSNQPYNGVLTNDYANLALAANLPSVAAGMQIYTHSGGNSNQTFGIRSADGSSHLGRFLRVDTTANLQILNSGFTSPVVTISDAGKITSLSGVELAGRVLFTTDSANDIGASTTANRPRDFYLGRDAYIAGKFGCNGVTPPAKAANPGTASGTDAAVINAITTILQNAGLCS